MRQLVLIVVVCYKVVLLQTHALKVHITIQFVLQVIQVNLLLIMVLLLHKVLLVQLIPGTMLKVILLGTMLKVVI